MLASAAWGQSVLRLVFAHLDAALYYNWLTVHYIISKLSKQNWLAAPRPASLLSYTWRAALLVRKSREIELEKRARAIDDVEGEAATQGGKPI
jgi:hypothetical protein